jgi:hypothetical protein
VAPDESPGGKPAEKEDGRDLAAYGYVRVSGLLFAVPPARMPTNRSPNPSDLSTSDRDVLGIWTFPECEPVGVERTTRPKPKGCLAWLISLISPI